MKPINAEKLLKSLTKIYHGTKEQPLLVLFGQCHAGDVGLSKVVGGRSKYLALFIHV